MDKDKKGETHHGFYWVYQDSINKIVLFDYQEGRGREGPLKMFENFTGYLQTDGYAAYDIFDKRGRLKIDNNPVENSIRPVALGRKIIY